MEIRIKQPWKVIAIHLVMAIPRAVVIAIIACIVLLVVALVIGAFAGGDTMAQFLNMLFLLVPMVFIGYLLYTLINIIQYARSAYIKIGADALQLFSRNITSTNDTSLPISQINNVTVDQNLSLKILGLSQISFSTDNGGNTSGWGFNFADAQEFAEEFRKKYRIKIAQ